METGAVSKNTFILKSSASTTWVRQERLGGISKYILEQ